MTRWRIFLSAAVCLAATAGMYAAAERIEVTPVVSNDRVLTSFSTPSSFASDAHEIVKSGLLLTFNFTVELRRPSAVWFDHTLTAVTVASSVKFDNLTGVYQVSKLVGGQVVWSEQSRHHPEVRQWMTSFEKVALVSPVPLESNAEYYVQVRMHATPKRTFSLWPFSGDTASGRADFTVIR
jgi:hypothetical protein